MSIAIVTSTEIARPVSVVAAYASDPSNARYRTIGLSAHVRPVVGDAIRRAHRNDLARLKELLERS